MRKTLFQVVSLLRRRVVNLLRPVVVSLNRRDVVNLTVFSTMVPYWRYLRYSKDNAERQTTYTTFNLDCVKYG